MSDEPTPIRRRNNAGQRPKRVKLAAVLAAEVGGLTLASEQTGIPKSTLKLWMDKPEYAEFRTKTREELADEVKLAAFLAWKRVIELAPRMNARDAIFASEKASTILQLLQGQATGRLEVRDVTETLDDHEREALSAVLREVMDATEKVEA